MMYLIISLSIASFLVSLSLTYIFKNYFFNKGFTGIDMFKPHHPSIPLLGGLSIPLTLLIFSIVGYYLNIIPFNIAISIFLVILIILIAGLVDDFMPVPGIYKPLICLLGGIPIVFFHIYNPHLFFPLNIGFRIAIIYSIIILIGVSVSANTVNMLDVINGSATTGGIMVLVAMLLSAYIIHGSVNPYLFIVGILTLAGFFFFNKYPAETFLGNAPALVIGGYIASLAIIYRIEFPTIISMFPFIHNSFFFLSKIKGFVEHKHLSMKVTTLDESGYIRDAGDDKAPITLLRSLVATSPLNEEEAFFNIFLLFMISLLLAIFSALLMR